MIRKACLEDFEAIKPLILSAANCVFEDALATKDTNKINDLLYLFYTNKNTKFCYKNIVVYTKDNVPIGCIIYYDSNVEEKLNNQMNKLINNDYHFNIESLPNTVYLDTLATNQAYTKQGIGSKLLNYCIDNSDKSLSLLVDVNKEKAKHLYERLGFEVVKTLNIFNETFYQMIYKK
ncbi:MAG: GNAT family N-acetyltransferase [Bacilli bacterium]|jgi:ribosomal protein S18 acetylase RimI-like enzyme|nr:GNAT family N-acetyltransferase [Bacilli bacterium]